MHLETESCAFLTVEDVLSPEQILMTILQKVRINYFIGP